MDIRSQLNQIWESFKTLDSRKKIGLGTGLTILLTAILLYVNIVNKPISTMLYANLSSQDINNMSRVLSKNSIRFSISSNNDSISVTPGLVTRARLMLAENGLPSSSRSGYELFDKVNTLGLTSFMQNVTNKRAVQGELARTIQMISGVKSARVHLVTNEKSVFRSRNKAAPSASLVVSTHGRLPNKTILAIRHMVAAAVPGLDTDNVTIVGADGTLLTVKGDDASGGITRLVELEKEYEREAERKIVSALGAHLGNSNFRVSVSAKLNIDQRREDETKFDPESRVERSFRSVKETDSAQNNASNQTTSITQNLPDENATPGPGQTSQESKERREETTNYEINSLKTSLVSNGYRIEKLSVALVVDKSRLDELLGDAPDKQELDDKTSELEAIIRSSISLSDERQDQISVNFVKFLAEEKTGFDAAPSAIESFTNTHLGSILNSLALIIAALVLVFLGLKPILTFLSRPSAQLPDNTILAIGQNNEAGENTIPNHATATNDATGDVAASVAYSLDKVSQKETAVRAQLEELIEQNEERVAIAIRQWLEPENIRQQS